MKRLFTVCLSSLGLGLLAMGMVFAASTGKAPAETQEGEASPEAGPSKSHGLYVGKELTASGDHHKRHHA